MSYNEKFGLGLLVIVCLYMAGVNLWLLFKDWLVEWSEKHQQEKEKQKPQRDVDDSQSIIGKLIEESLIKSKSHGNKR